MVDMKEMSEKTGISERALNEITDLARKLNRPSEIKK